MQSLIRVVLKSIVSLLVIVAFADLHAQTLTQEIDALIAQKLPHAYVGVLVQDAASGRVIYQRNSHQLFSPASNIKLLTAAAALYQLGSYYRYTTSLSQQGEDIYLTFRGDPSLKVEQLKQLLVRLKGLKTIRHVVLDTSRFKPPYYPPGVSYDDLGWYFVAPSLALMLNENAESYEVKTAKEQGKLIEIKAQNPEPALRLVNQVVTVSQAQAKAHCSLDIQVQPNNTLKLYGCLAQREQPIKMQFAIPDPILFAKQLIQRAIRNLGVHLKGQMIEGKTPPQAKRIAEVQSDELAKLIKHMLEESDNLYADSLTKLLGFVVTGEGTYKQGAFAMKKILSAHTHLNMQLMELADGLGTRYNHMTPEQFVVLLNDLYHQPKFYPLFIDALPRMGVSGSLKDRMKKTPLENKVFAKTGTMHDISALSGYMRLPSGKVLIFSIMSNDVIGHIQAAKSLEDQILLKIYHREGLL